MAKKKIKVDIVNPTVQGLILEAGPISWLWGRHWKM